MFFSSITNLKNIEKLFNLLYYNYKYLANSQHFQYTILTQKDVYYMNNTTFNS